MMNQRFSVLGAGFWVLVLGSGFGVGSQTTAAQYDALKQELLEMREADQRFRDSGPVNINPTETELATIMKQDALDRANMARLAQIVQTYGWPGIKQVGEAASTAAFLILQHTQVRSGPDRQGKLVLHPVEDEDNVNARRTAVGLPPLAEYLKEFGIVYIAPK